MNPTQLVWVQTDIGSERYHFLFKMTNRQKKRDVDCTVHTAHTTADVAVRTTRVDSWHVTWHVCSERDDDTWPIQWLPHVIYLLV